MPPDTEIRWEKTTAVAVKIKLKRLGKIRAPYYRIVVADARTKRDGRAIEEIGKYHPKAEPSFIEVNSERAQHWLAVGAQPTDPVRKLLEITGDWQKFKGLPGAEGTLRTPEAKADRKVAFAEALQETLEAGGATSKTKSRGKASDSGTASKGGRGEGGRGGKSDSAKADSAKADAGKADTSKADTSKADSAKAPKAETRKADAGKADSAKADAGKADAGKADSAKADSAKADAGKADSGKADSGKADSSKADSGKAESGTGDKAKATADAEATAEAGDSASSEG
jgi:small subunit ribosomal protein S16